MGQVKFFSTGKACRRKKTFRIERFVITVIEREEIGKRNNCSRLYLEKKIMNQSNTFVSYLYLTNCLYLLDNFNLITVKIYYELHFEIV